MAEGNGSDASLADFIWKNAEDLWGDFKHTDFGKVILPFTLLRRLECVLEKTRKDGNRLAPRRSSGPGDEQHIRAPYPPFRCRGERGR
jgi:type I restriction enzyme M protein